MAAASPKIAFAGGTLDRATHLRDDGSADRLRLADGSRAVLVGEGQEVAVTDDRALALVPVIALADGAELTFLGLDADRAAVFAHDAAAGAPTVCETLSFVPLRGLADELDPVEAALAAYAVALIGWHRVQRRCGRCGSATEVTAAGHRRHCPVCGLLQFPRTDPAITMLVQSADSCLLSRRRGAPENRWSALAGFVEPGETPEQAVIREAREETGVEVASVEYVASQPWPFPQALMIGFWAFAGSAAADADPTPDAKELVEARWWARDQLEDALSSGAIVLPPPGTIGNYLISVWLGAGP